MTSPATEVIDVTATSESIVTSNSVLKSIVLPIIYSLVCGVGLIGNGMIIYIIQVKMRGRSITDVYVINLAIADFIFLAMLPFWIIDLAAHDRWWFGRTICKLSSASTHIHMYASVFFLAAMAVDRFIAVVCYLNSKRTKHGAIGGCLVLWIMAIIMSILPYQFRDLATVNDYSTCVWAFNDTDTIWFLMQFLLRSVIAFALPFVVIVVCYIWIAVFLKSRKTSGRLTSQRQDKATVMVLVIIAVFLLCWLPNQLSNFVYVGQGLGFIPAGSHGTAHYYIHMFSNCLAWGHSCMNPILYLFMREDIKLKVTEILHTATKRCRGASSTLERKTPTENNSNGQLMALGSLRCKRNSDSKTPPDEADAPLAEDFDKQHTVALDAEGQTQYTIQAEKGISYHYVYTHAVSIGFVKSNNTSERGGCTLH
uniref:neuropeptides B/W receptor type 1-like isoform X2 n=1 Tax=Ciona intestinalis TaxID=7719 RepID=UPI000EF4936D|nr:neuropeptides B/W receptor type 1-like isoform X2 [Ciona intestinalis]|eukprot:XP_026690820.1 neuropeptides B/W receptor type 1-like isoform X2 [Ciona intestinalis]